MVPDLLRFITRTFLRAFYGLRFEGAEKIPPSGRLIVACNHVSNADPPALDVFISTVRRPTFLTKREIFGVPLLGWLMRECGNIPVDRHRPGGDMGALRSVLKALDEESCVVMFPEGTRAKGAAPSKPKQGIAFLAAKSGAPVLAVRLFGTKGFPLSRRMKVKAGALIAPPTGGKADYAEFTEKIMSEISSITEENAAEN